MVLTSNVPFPYLGTGHVITRGHAVNVDSFGFMLMYNFLHEHHILIESYSFSLIFLFLYMWGLGAFLVFFGVCETAPVYTWGSEVDIFCQMSSSSPSRPHSSLSALGTHRLVRLRGWWALGIHLSLSTHTRPAVQRFTWVLPELVWVLRLALHTFHRLGLSP